MTTPTPVYLDYNATAPIHPQVADEVAHALHLVGNPSSVHQAGRQARSVIEEARMHVSRLVDANPSEIVFTSGGTEANAMAILGADAERIICMASEHSSVLEPARNAEKPFETCPVDSDGLIRLDALRAALEAGGKALVCVQLANNETGVIQPVHEVARLVHEYDGLLHMDAIQAAGKIPVDVAELGADFVSLSAHKIGGPAGVGALIIRKGHELKPLLKGGGQESRRRSGTENLIGIAGFGEAAKIAHKELSAYAALSQLRDRLEAEIVEASADEAIIYGKNAPRLPNTSNIGMPGIDSETQVMAFDLEGYCVSAGSACSSGKVSASHVLQAMGASETSARQAIRVSLGWATSEEDVSGFIEVWKRLYRRLKGRKALG